MAIVIYRLNFRERCEMMEDYLRLSITAYIEKKKEESKFAIHYSRELDFDREAVEKRIREIQMNFSDCLIEYAKEKNMENADVYNKAGVDRRVFSKMLTEHGYKPSRETAIRYALALELNLEDTNRLLSKAGFTLSKSDTRDIILMYCIEKEIYKIDEVNNILIEFDQKEV